jgi:hypothetical protein
MLERLLRGTWRSVPYETRGGQVMPPMPVSAAKRAIVADLARSAVAFDVQPVSDLFYAHPKEVWIWQRDFPNLAPVAPIAWFETGRPPRLYSDALGERPVDEAFPGLRLGAFCLSFDRRDLENPTDELARAVAWWTTRWLVDELGTMAPLGWSPVWEERLSLPWRWWQAWLGFYWIEGTGVIGPMVWSFLPIGEEGEVLLYPATAVPYGEGRFAERVAEIAAQQGANAGGPDSLLFPTALALSFLHCRNVARTPAPSTLSGPERRRLERQGLPLVSWHTLDVKPFGKAAREDAARRDREGAGLAREMAAHIVRGHFAHYGEAFGTGKLFGKHEGMFWIPAHVRGSVEVGTAGKDYRVVL